MLVNEQPWWKEQAWTAVVMGDDGAEAHQRATRCIIFEKQIRGRIFETETVNRYYHFVSQALRIPMDRFFLFNCVQLYSTKNGFNVQIDLNELLLERWMGSPANSSRWAHFQKIQHSNEGRVTFPTQGLPKDLWRYKLHLSI